MLIFIVLRFRARLRFFPMWQQALAVLALLLNDRIVVHHGARLRRRTDAARRCSGCRRWSAWSLWPFVFLLLDDLRGRLRVSDS